MIKLFVSDVDGTLLDKNAQLGIEEVEIIQKLQEAGIVFMLASGRNNYKASMVLEKHGLKAPSICLNGAALYSENKERLLVHYLDEEALDIIHGLSLKTNTVLALHANEKIYSTFSRQQITDGYENWQRNKYGYQNSYANLADCWFNVDLIPSIDYEFIKSEKPVKAEFIFCTEEASKLIKETLAKKFNLNMCGSGFVNNLEITAIEAEKGKMIRSYCELNGIDDDEVAVIGDSDNDTGMFREYPKYSFAMGNSTDSVKKQASFVTGSNNEHGFYKVAQMILKRNEDERN